ncbi:MAG TPA: extracellular solute-binding protein [Nitrososphaerales archaeon]|nr:extracellular solute-binding protein [Nitrososphaerales archaeon]
MQRRAMGTPLKVIAVVVVVAIVVAAAYYFLLATISGPSTTTNSPVTLTVYGSVHTTDLQTVLKDFHGNYSWITVNYVELTPPAALTRLTSELGGNKSTADVVFETNSVVNVMKSKGFLTPYNSTQLSNYPPNFYDKSGYWATAILLPVAFSYNTQALSSSTLPTLAGIVDPSWKGKVTILDPTLGSTGTQYLLSMVPALGNQTWTSWVQNLETVDAPSPTSDTTALAQNVASGQFEIGVFTYLHDAVRLENGGAHIGWFLPKLANGSSLPLYTAFSSVAIVKGTPHTQAAKDFVDFILSRAGQETIGNSAVRVPAMPGLNTPYSLGTIAPGAKVIYFPTPQVSAVASKWGNIFKQWGY